MAVSGRGAGLDLKRILGRGQLPALPQSAIRLLELSQDPENGPAEFAMPLEADPGLAGQILKFVNSSYFGFAREISSVKQALSLVGVRTIKNFALWSAVFSLMPNPKCGPFDLKGLWQDSLRRALFARDVAKRLGLRESEEVFAAALLQDMAVPLLAKEAPDHYVALLGARNHGSTRLSELELEKFGWTHAEAAKLMAHEWNLPDQFAELIGSHLAIDHWAKNPGSDKGKYAVALSALLPSTADDSWSDFGLMEAHLAAADSNSRTTLTSLLDHTDEEFTQFAPVLRIPNPRKSLRQSWEDMMVVPSN